MKYAIFLNKSQRAYRIAREFLLSIHGTAMLMVWLVMLYLLAVMLIGCTSMAGGQGAAASARADGIYCESTGCDEMKCATGQAALAATGRYRASGRSTEEVMRTQRQ